MKVKYLLIYIALGAAFVAVSLWAFLSKGRNPKALRLKYKLGGLLLSTWAMLTAVSCGTTACTTVTCYEPVVTCYDAVMENNAIEIAVKGSEGANSFKPGDILAVHIFNPSYPEYILRIYKGEDSSKLLQEQALTGTVVDNSLNFEVKVAETKFKGQVTVSVFSVMTENGEKTESILSSQKFTLN